MHVCVMYSLGDLKDKIKVEWGGVKRDPSYFDAKWLRTNCYSNEARKKVRQTSYIRYYRYERPDIPW